LRARTGRDGEREQEHGSDKWGHVAHLDAQAIRRPRAASNARASSTTARLSVRRRRRRTRRCPTPRCR
jgi:hypothetical protein